MSARYHRLLLTRSLECYASFAVLPYAYLQLGESDKASEAAESAYALCRQIVDRKMRAKTCMAVARTLQMVASSDAETCIREAGLLGFSVCLEACFWCFKAASVRGRFSCSRRYRRFGHWTTEPEKLQHSALLLRTGARM